MDRSGPVAANRRCRPYRSAGTSRYRCADPQPGHLGRQGLQRRRLLPRVLNAARPQLVLTGSTSALPRSGRPEVAFGASKFALNGIAEALREGFRERRLAVTSLQLGYLNTDDALSVPVADAAARGEGGLVPVHDVGAMVRALLQLSPSGFVRELVLPAIADPRY
ncbi:hypothetical protein G6F57_019362 [Rhizopus arrhizus]|nr:hypothetical protein G6F57_019362 [Rhizopus arrhizus]